jgi:hypothetical protein
VESVRKTISYLTSCIFDGFSSLSTAIEILGEESGLFLKGLAQMSTYLGTGLMNGGSSSFTGIA